MRYECSCAQNVRVFMQRHDSLMGELCRCLHSVMCELEAETTERVRLQSALATIQAAQRRQNAALSKLMSRMRAETFLESNQAESSLKKPNEMDCSTF
jgi:hypothetical protein